MKKHLLLTLLLSGVWKYAQALQVKDVVLDERLSCKVSAQDLNRIEVRGDRIKQVFGNSGLFMVENDAGLGHLYIKPTRQSTPISLTLTTEKGVVQDLLLIPQSIPSETIILRPSAKSEERSLKTKREQVISLMQQVVQGGLPFGYEADFNEQHLSLWKNVQTKRILYLAGDVFEVEVIHLENTQDQVIRLHEKQFISRDKPTLAVGITSLQVRPGKSTKIYRVLASKNTGHGHG